MKKLKINFISMRENFIDEVREPDHELEKLGEVTSHGRGGGIAQFTFMTEQNIEGLREALKEAGFSKENGLSIALYDSEPELEDQ